VTFQVLHNSILIRRLGAGARIGGGLTIPGTTKEIPVEGEIVAVGSGLCSDDGEVIPLEAKAGDHILFRESSGAGVQLDGQELIIMKESDILGIVC